MTKIYDCDPSELIEKTSEELMKVESIKAPDWASFVKTGVHKERPPANSGWWYVRAASVLRKIYTLGPIGVSKLRVKYGGKKNRGVKTEHFYRGSGNILRKIMQQLEKEGFVKIDLKSKHKGRLITAKGKKFLDEIAGKISNVKVEKPVELKVEGKKDAAKGETKKPDKPKTDTKKEVKAESKQENKAEQQKDAEQYENVKKKADVEKK
jgi:small subunit ribosomal protein S19e